MGFVKFFYSSGCPAECDLYDESQATIARANNGSAVYPRSACDQCGGVVEWDH